jgi:hypothetical protein
MITCHYLSNRAVIMLSGRDGMVVNGEFLHRM